MNKKLKQKWIKALRSGEFKQCTGQLKAPKVKEYCCLGVLCNIAKDTRNIESRGGLLKRQLKAFDLPAEKENMLICMNDYQGLDFNTIADWIEVNL